VITLSNPLNLAIIGNPGPRRKRGKKAVAAARRLSQLKSRWKSRTKVPGGRWAGFRAVVRNKAGKRKHAPGRKWAWTGRKGTVSLWKGNKMKATNPIGKSLDTLVVKPVTSLPKSIPALFKGKVANNALWATGGAIAALTGGALVQKTILGAVGRFLPAAIAAAMSRGIVQRIVGASFALVTGGVIAKFAVKSAASKQAFITGTAAAALIEAVFPGRAANMLSQIPVIGPYVASSASPVQGLAGMFGSDELAAYVESPAYQGVGAYVESPAYQGVGAYVESPAYQGVGGLNGPMDNAVAGLGYDPNELAGGHLNGLGAMGSNMASHLD